jgi:hypothetical protein
VALWIKKQLGSVVADFPFLSAEDWQSYRDLNATAYIRRPVPGHDFNAQRSASKLVCERVPVDHSGALKSPTVVERYAALGFESPDISLQSFGDLIRRETDAWAGVIKTAAVHLD